jgi:formylglycine-generating enzyme required for sulfatase activity
MEFVWIDPGEFDMGSPAREPDRDKDEGPVHRVKLTKGYFLGKFEVTQGQWKAVMGNNPSSFSTCGDNCPVERVSWEDAHEYIRRLNAKERGNVYRLPTEAEWEYAARAGTTGEWYGDLNRIAWYWSNSGSRTHPVGKKLPNAWGLHDMIGNVWEWVDDWFDYYSPGPQVDPAGPSLGMNRVNRGGSWNVVAEYCRTAYRAGYGPVTRINYLGFRLALGAASHQPWTPPPGPGGIPPSP